MNTLQALQVVCPALYLNINFTGNKMSLFSGAYLDVILL